MKLKFEWIFRNWSSYDYKSKFYFTLNKNNILGNSLAKLGLKGSGNLANPWHMKAISQLEFWASVNFK